MKRTILLITAFIVVLTAFSANKEKFTTHITLTTYNATKAQCNNNPLLTADGTKINLQALKEKKIKYCAVARNLLPYIPYGSIIHIEGHGYYEVHDTMNKRFQHYVDILQDINEKGFKKTNVKITLIKKGDGKYKHNS